MQQPISNETITYYIVFFVDHTQYYFAYYIYFLIKYTYGNFRMSDNYLSCSWIPNLRKHRCRKQRLFFSTG